jgi:hypothetical protein
MLTTTDGGFFQYRARPWSLQALLGVTNRSETLCDETIPQHTPKQRRACKCGAERREYLRFGSQKVSSVACSCDAKVIARTTG